MDLHASSYSAAGIIIPTSMQHSMKTFYLIVAVVAVKAQQTGWGQCGGIGWGGPTTCVSGWTCEYSNPYFSQCLPNTGATTSSSQASIPAQTSTAGSGSVPTSCAGVAAPAAPWQLASGWSAVKVAGGLSLPRGITIDTSGNLLVIEEGKGITALTPSSDGCIASTKSLLSLPSLNHGIYLSPDGKTLYASSLTTVFSWEYDADTLTLSSSSTTLVQGMNPGGHPSRTLVISGKHPNLLVIQEGSNENLDEPAGNINTERGVVKVFDISSAPAGGYDWMSGGYQAGYGLRNEVGLVFDGNDM